MQPDPEALKLANNSGFPLQIAIERAVQESSNIHGWSVRHTEHAWSNSLYQQNGFIDLVLQDQHKSTFLVVECKRFRQAAWLFMHSSGETKQRKHAKSWVSQYSDGRMTHFNWYDVAIDPASPEAMFCAVIGQSATDRSTLLERIGAEVVASTEALANEERDFRPDGYQSIRFYFSVIVTTAELKIAQFDPNVISLADGTIPDAEFETVPFVRFRKQLSMRPVNLSPKDYESGMDLSNSRQDTVFVVRADALVDFLQRFDIPTSELRRY